MLSKLGRVCLKNRMTTMECGRMWLCGGTSSLSTTVAATNNNNNNNNDKQKTAADNDESWLSKHSGKVGLVALTISITLIYRYFKSVTMRTEQEKTIADSEAIEPYEYNELKNNNKIPITLYNEIIQAVIHKHSNSNSSSSLSYNDFITSVTTHIIIEGNKYGVDRLQSGHLLDRVLLKHIINNNNNNSSSSNDNNNNSNISSDNNDVFEIPVDVNFLLVMLGMTVQGPVEGKIRSMFALINDSGNNNSSSNSNNNDDSSTDNNEISKEMAEILLKHLIDTCQIPSEKQVIETGVSYPLTTYRRKTPKEMIKSYCDIKKYQKSSFNIQEFEDMLLSGSICLLGECYRSR